MLVPKMSTNMKIIIIFCVQLLFFESTFCPNSQQTYIFFYLFLIEIDKKSIKILHELIKKTFKKIKQIFF